MREKNIVFLGFLEGYGGAEKSMIMTANGLQAQGKKVSIISFNDDNLVYEIDENIDLYFIKDIKGKKIKVIYNRYIQLKKQFEKINPDIVISFWFQPAILSVILSRFFKFVTIYSERGDPGDSEYTGLLGILRNYFIKKIDGLVFQTNAALNYFPENIRKKSVVINNPVYIKYNDYELPAKRNNIIVNIGRLHKQKNQKLLIDSFSKIATEFPDVNVHIYGEGELEEELKMYIKEIELDNRIFLMGTTDNIYEEIKDSRMFVLSSDYEGMPNALMEAMALGLPVITTDYRPYSASELISNGQNGLVVELNSESLANGLKHMLSDNKKANKMGMKAKEICNTHSYLKTIEKWEDYINIIIQK